MTAFPIIRAAVAGPYLLAFLAFLFPSTSSHGASFYPIADIDGSTSGSDLWPASNLIQGPGTGFDAAEPHDKTLDGASGNWATADPGGFPSDYLAVAGPPVFVIDLGADVPLGEISIWGYASTNANGVREFGLRFATDSEGASEFGSSIDFQPTYTALNDGSLRQSFAFGRVVTARFVEFTALDNFFNESTGGQSDPPGGDRIGLGEIAFAIPSAGGEPDIDVPPAVGLELTGGVESFDLAVRNLGGAALEVVDASFSGPDAAAFSVVDLPDPIPVGGEDVIIVSFNASGLTGNVSATLMVASNDPDEPTTSVELTGFIRDPGIGTTPDSLNFGLVAPDGGLRSLPLVLRNLGGGNTLAVDAFDVTGPGRDRFAFTGVPASIPPLGEVVVTVTFDPAGASGAVSAAAEFDTNDPLSPRLVVPISAMVGSAPPPSAVRISEFMASNGDTIEDGDGVDSDWIEIYNDGAAPVDLVGWHLTDDPDNLTRWTFPPVTVPARGYLLVFASGRGDPVYVDPEGHLHTDFRLAAEGEYLALVRPDGTTLASEFAPAFPPQFRDVGYGSFSSGGSVENLVAASDASVLVPSGGTLGESWTLPAFVPGAEWIQGTGQGVGFDQGADYRPFITTDINAEMRGVNGSVYIRLPFDLTDLPSVEDLTLRVRFDDGFVAWLNGVEIGSRNAPGSPAWNSVATTSNPDTAAVVFLDLDASEGLPLLVEGTNVLAIQGLNASAGSSDFLIEAQLVARRSGDGPPTYGYLLEPTPGRANSDSIGNPGPEFVSVSHSPSEPSAGEDIVVLASLAPRLAPLGDVDLDYRVMFGPVTTIPMNDDGQAPDTVAGDGIHAARIPGSAFGPGDMVRWKVTARDTAGNASRHPAFLDRTGNGQSPEYLGTVVPDPSVASDIPLFLWFTENVAASHTRSGTRAAVFFRGHFLDNVFVRQRGGSTNASVSQKFNFNPGDPLFIDEEMRSVGEININGPGSDPSYIRQPLAFETYRTAGNASCHSELWHLRVNRNFDRVGIFIEQVDDDFLERNGYDPDGDLYKFVQRSNLNPVFADTTTGIEKKTGNPADLSTVEALVAGLNRPTGTQRRAFAFDHLDLPQILNYLAVRSITQDADDVRKNFYMYVDHRGDALWRIFPWDKDWTFGVTGDGGTFLAHPFFGDQEHAKQNANQWNVLYDVLFEETPIREMYLRRLRTVMEEILQPTSVPSGERYLEQRTNEIFAPASTLLGGGPAAARNSVLSFFNQRRNSLFGTFGPGGASPLVPASQAAEPDLAIAEVDASPASGNQDEEFVRIANNESTEIDISGWTLEGGVDFVFAPGTVVPRNGNIFVSPSVGSFRARTDSPRGGEGHLVVGPYSGHLSSFGESLLLRDRAGALVSEFSYVGDPSDAQRWLVVSEIMYHPAAPHSDAEFIELTNISESVTLDLSGVRFTDGVTFDFTGSGITSLAPGARVLVVLDRAAFEAVHGPGLPVAGEFAGGTRLGNDGENLKLEDAANGTIKEFRYNDRIPWPEAADGFGYSLVLAAPTTNPDPAIAANWRAGSTPGGTPDGADPTTTLSGPPDADSDGDGLNALVEHALGLSDADPLDAATALRVVGPSADSGGIEITFPRNAQADDVVVSLEVSHQLGAWTAADSSTAALVSIDPGHGPRTSETWRIVSPSPEPRFFVRLRITSRPR